VRVTFVDISYFRATPSMGRTKGTWPSKCQWFSSIYIGLEWWGRRFGSHENRLQFKY